MHQVNLPDKLEVSFTGDSERRIQEFFYQKVSDSLSSYDNVDKHQFLHEDMNLKLNYLIDGAIFTRTEYQKKGSIAFFDLDLSRDEINLLSDRKYEKLATLNYLENLENQAVNALEPAFKKYAKGLFTENPKFKELKERYSQ